LLITVLHHMPAHFHAPAIQEGIRVLREGGRLIVMEDIFRGDMERLATYIADSIMNLEFVKHPHSNRSLEEWRDLISKTKGSLVHSSDYIAWYGPFRFRHAIFVIEKVAL